MSERNNTECHWDEFCDWAEDNDIPSPRHAGSHREDWEPWFDCWNAALDAREESEAAKEKT